MKATKYKYDVAISLLKQDVDYARKLVKALNPGLKVFFYEDKQEELIAKSAPEVFAKAFKEEARVVVILSRKEWSETFYTDIERNAIIDRTSVKDEGYNFLMVLPMEPGQAPSWYPSTYIYVNPRNFTIEQIARFIEFKVTELGGEVKPVTFEERMDNLQSKMDKKKEIIQYLFSTESVKEAEAEIKKIMDLFNEKIALVETKGLNVSVFNRKFNKDPLYSRQPLYGEMGLEDKRLQLTIQVDSRFTANVRSSQEYKFWLTIYKPKPTLQDKDEILVQKAYRYNKTNEHNFGWAEEIQCIVTDTADLTIGYLFQASGGTYYYDLKEVITSEALIEHWFTELFKLVEEKFKPLLP